MIEYTVTNNRRLQVRHMLSFKGEAQTVSYDFAPWEVKNGAVSSVTWTVKSGSAAISNESLASSKAQAVITTSDVGSSLIEIKAVSGNNTFITDLRVYTKDPQSKVSDYGMCS